MGKGRIFFAFLAASISSAIAQNNASYGFLADSSYLVSSFTFGSGQFLLDSSGHENLNPSANPPTQSTSCYFDNGCAQFNSSQLNSFNLTSFQFQSSFSVCLWFNSLPFSDAYPVLVDYGNGANSNEMYIALTPSNFILYLYHGGGVTFTSLINSITTNYWHHICVTRTASGFEDESSWNFYVNGTQLQQGTDFTVSFYANFPALSNGVNTQFNYIGRPISTSETNSNKHLTYFSGKIDEFRWYNFTVSSRNVSALFKYYRCAKRRVPTHSNNNFQKKNRIVAA